MLRRSRIEVHWELILAQARIDRQDFKTYQAGTQTDSYHIWSEKFGVLISVSVALKQTFSRLQVIYVATV